MYTVDDVRLIDNGGPWRTKSDSNFDLLVNLSATGAREFLGERQVVVPPWWPSDLPFRRAKSGLRIYTVGPIAQGKEGGSEAHFHRLEYSAVLVGQIHWFFEDLSGNTKELVLSPCQVVIIPPSVMHSYRALVDECRLVTFCNTVFSTEEQPMPDVYTMAEFRRLQEAYRDW